MNSLARFLFHFGLCFSFCCVAVQSAPATILFDQSFSGQALADEVDAGRASYPGSPGIVISGTRLDLTNTLQSSILYRMPIQSAGSLAGYTNLSITINADYEQLTGDNDLGIGISDGTSVLGVMMGDQAFAWALDGSDGGTVYLGDFDPSGAFSDNLPLTIQIDPGNSPDLSKVTITNSSADSLSFAGLAGIDYDGQIDFVLVSDHVGEQYGLNSIDITATALPIPVPGAFLLSIVGVALTNELRRRRVV